MNTEEKLFALVQRLSAKTKEGTVTWETTMQKDTFQAAFPTYTVKLASRPGDEGAPDYILSILNESGVVIERTSDVELSKTFPNGRAFGMMDEMFTSARRQALGVDTALDSLLGELDA